jgi:CBS domain-containing protein
MKVRELMTPDPEVCAATESCAAVGSIMRRRRCGFVPIVDDRQTGRVVGVVTDRDLALHLTDTNLPSYMATVQACMSAPVISAAPDDDLTDAAAKMEAAKIHRLPVVEDGRLVGVLSLRDIARAARREWRHVGPHPAEQQAIEILEATAAN